ncbi:SPOR domain-containing protein [Neisseria leonii]|uniref:SPOR domain-containing protein n=1 Tax=Neisseria leonii TaxID=2995413 RepID=A0A9X4E4N3_9NEIS|nr:SPOR domain-containing protein [Neisseria sp. 51.81]MDD9327302.1 SPOR domain-containing protein [Neisseria sp. 51.81]
MNRHKQDGKGISGFVLGLLLATLIIAALVFFLNQNRRTDFKEPEIRREAPPTEVLTPPTALGSSPASDVLPDTGAASEVVIDGTPAEPPPASEPEEPKPAPIPKTPAKPDGKPAAKPQETKKQPEPKRDQAKPTPEEILDNGSVDKAREAARAREAERKKAQAALNGEAGKSAQPATPHEGGIQGRVILQAGSYADQGAADIQRAKLAMLGVSASVVKAEVNGKTMYRVQTGRLNAEAAAQTKRKLQQNGIDSFARQAK